LTARLVAMTFCAKTSSIRLKMPSDAMSCSSSWSRSLDLFQTVELMLEALSFCHWSWRVLTVGTWLTTLRGAVAGMGAPGAPGAGGGGGGGGDGSDVDPGAGVGAGAGAGGAGGGGTDPCF
jgi:hypothetical protein